MNKFCIHPQNSHIMKQRKKVSSSDDRVGLISYENNVESLLKRSFKQCIFDHILYFYLWAKCNNYLGYVNLKPMCPVVSVSCGVVTRGCLAMCLHVSSSCHTVTELLSRTSKLTDGVNNCFIMLKNLST